jgi:hypothetical protein
MIRYRCRFCLERLGTPYFSTGHETFAHIDDRLVKSPGYASWSTETYAACATLAPLANIYDGEENEDCAMFIEGARYHELKDVYVEEEREEGERTDKACKALRRVLRGCRGR